MTPPTITEARALYESVPSIVSEDGDATIKQRALACEIVRLSDPGLGWRIQYPQEKTATLASGEVIHKAIGPTAPIYASDLIDQTVEIDGKLWPVALAFVIINAVYVREATLNENIAIPPE